MHFAADPGGGHRWALHAGPIANSMFPMNGFCCSATSASKVWRDAPPVLAQLFGELFQEQPADALYWLHEATWRLYSQQWKAHEPMASEIPGGEDVLVQLPTAAQLPSHIREQQARRGVTPDTLLSPMSECEEHAGWLSQGGQPLPRPSQRMQEVVWPSQRSSQRGPAQYRLEQQAMESSHSPDQPELPVQPVQPMATERETEEEESEENEADEQRKESKPTQMEQARSEVRSNAQSEFSAAALPSQLLPTPVLHRLGSAPLASDGHGLSPPQRMLGAILRRSGGVGYSSSPALTFSRTLTESNFFRRSAERFRGSFLRIHTPTERDNLLMTAQPTTLSDERVTWGMLHPMGRPRFYWDCLFLLGVVYSIWSSTFDLAFGVSDSPVAARTLSVVTIAFFSADILVNLNTGFIRDDQVVMRRGSAIWNYFTGWFFIDVMTVVPDVVMLAATLAGDEMIILRILRMRKIWQLIRAVRLVRSFWILSGTGGMVGFQFVQCHVALLLITHVNAVVWAACHSEWQEPGGVPTTVAFSRYLESMAMVYRALTYGDDVYHHNSSQEAISMFVCFQRVTLFFLLLSWLVWRLLCKSAAESSESIAKEMALGYLKHHGVSTRLQLKVLRNLSEACVVRRQLEQFNRLALEAFPPNLRQTVCHELWSQRLLSLDICLEVAKWDASFIKELSLVVYEQVIPSKVVVFSVGEASDAAHLVLRGCLACTYHEFEQGVPDFTPGMWVGEKALANPRMRRYQTMVCKSLCQLMSVPTEAFHKLLAQFSLKDMFTSLLNERLWLGLCGRCGALGDHYSSTCPLLTAGMRRTFIAAHHTSLSRSSSGSAPRKPTGLRGSVQSISSVVKIYSGQRQEVQSSNSDSDRATKNSDLRQFLRRHKMEHLFGHMARHGIVGLNDLKLASVEALRSDPEVQLTQKEEKTLCESAVHAFRKEMGMATNKFLQTSEVNDHYVFISHYKAEAGTTASLMQEMLTRMLQAKPNSVTSAMEVPVFLDSEDLKDLGDLKRHVLKSHNIVLLLTQGILTRPWCLLEIVTAVEHGAHILPVRVEEPGACFEFPDDYFYQRLRAGLVFDHSCMKFLESEGIELAALEAALRQVFLKIAVPFSPHKTANIRMAELDDLLKECRLRTEQPDADKKARTKLTVPAPTTPTARSVDSCESSCRRASGTSSIAGEQTSAPAPRPLRRLL